MSSKLFIIITLTCMILKINSYCQELEDSDLLFHGTVIAVAICEDGILFASDSRSSFTLNEKYSNQVYAYIENDRKIFEIGEYLIANSGLSMFNKKFMEDIIHKFNKVHREKSNIETTFNNFFDFLKDEQNIPDSTLFIESDFIIAGYENSKPKIISQGKTGRMYQENIGHMIHSDTELPKFLNLSRDIKLTCKNLSPYMEKGIYNLAEYRADNKVGGPLEIIQITPLNDHITLKSFQKNHFKNYKDMAKAILTNKIEVKYIFPISEELLKKTLKEGIELGY